MKLMNFKNYPRLCLFATREIQKGEELRYDYGDDPFNLFWRHQVDNLLSNHFQGSTLTKIVH